MTEKSHIRTILHVQLCGNGCIIGAGGEVLLCINDEFGRHIIGMQAKNLLFRFGEARRWRKLVRYIATMKELKR